MPEMSGYIEKLTNEISALETQLAQLRHEEAKLLSTLVDKVQSLCNAWQHKEAISKLQAEVEAADVGQLTDEKAAEVATSRMKLAKIEAILSPESDKLINKNAGRVQRITGLEYAKEAALALIDVK